MSHVYDICEMKSKLIDYVKIGMNCDLSNIDAAELGEVVDMIKDCYEIEEHYWKSEYYKLLVEDDESEMYDSRYGYNPNQTPESMIKRGLARYNGRRGYIPTEYDMTQTPDTAYERYENARRHYTATHSIHDKEEMDMYANKHLSDTVSSIKDIWHNADHDMREKMKKDINNLVSSMN